MRHNKLFFFWMYYWRYKNKVCFEFEIQVFYIKLISARV